MTDINLASTADVNTVQTNLDDHESDSSNPHNVSIDQTSDVQDFLINTAANTPTAGTVDRLAVESDSKRIVYDDGTNWIEIAVAPSEIGAADLGFDPLTQSDLDNHTSDSSAHHTKYTDSEAVTAVNNESSLSVDISGDAETVDGFHASDLGSDVSGNGTTVVSNATDINFANNLDVTDDGDGTVTIDTFNKYTDSEAVSAVNSETSLSVDITGVADSTQSDIDSHTSSTNNPHGVTAGQVDAIPESDRGTASGVATLTSGGVVPESQVPALAISETDVVADQTERLALDAEKGDVAIQQDENQSYILQGSDPSTDSNWKVLKSPTDAVDSVFGRTGAITAESGDYDVSQITNAASDSDVSSVQSNIDSHTSDSNPHSGSASESWVDNNYNNYTFSESYTDLTNRSHGNEDHDVDFAEATSLNSHTSSTSNPHSVTLEQARSQNNQISGPLAFSNSFDITDYNASSVVLRNPDNSNGFFFEDNGNFDAPTITTNDVTADDVNPNNKLGVPSVATRSDIPSGQEGMYYVEDEGQVILRTNDDLGTADGSGNTNLEGDLYVSGELYATSENYQVYHEGNFDPTSSNTASEVEATDGSLIKGNENPEYSSVSDAESAGLASGTTVWVNGSLYVEDGT